MAMRFVWLNGLPALRFGVRRSRGLAAGLLFSSVLSLAFVCALSVSAQITPVKTPVPIIIPTPTPTPLVLRITDVGISDLEINQSLLIAMPPEDAVLPVSLTVTKKNIPILTTLTIEFSLVNSSGIESASWTISVPEKSIPDSTNLLELELPLTDFTPLDIDTYLLSAEASLKGVLTESDTSNNTTSSPSTVLLQTSGTLWFGSIQTILDPSTVFTLSPTVLNGAAQFGDRTVSFGSLTVDRDSSTLDLNTVFGKGTVPDIDPHTSNDWDYQLTGIYLNKNGGFANTALYFPETVSYRLASTTGYTFRTDPLDLGRQAFDQDLALISTEIATTESISLYAETLPLYFNGDSAVFDTTGGLSLVNPTAEYIHASRIAIDTGDRATNDGLFKTSWSTGSVTVSTSGLQTDLSGASGQYQSAFPYQNDVIHGDVSVSIKDGSIDGTSSTIASLEVKQQSQISACEGSEADLESQFAFDDIVSLSLDGGIAHEAAISSVYTFAFNTTTGEALSRAAWFQPGFVLRTTASSSALDEVDRYLLAGRSTSSKELYYYGGDSFVAGDGYYAGINFMPDHLSGMAVNVDIGDDSLGVTLNEGSKFYIRGGGYSGTLDGTLGADTNLELYPDPDCSNQGYQIELSSFGQAYLDNESEGLDSKIDGVADIPFPAQIDIPFDDMTLNPCGYFTSGQIPEDEQNVTRTLAYWLADLRLSTIDFELREENSPDDDRTLWVSSVNDVDGLDTDPLMQINLRPCGTIAESMVAEPVDTALDGYGTTIETLYLTAYDSSDGTTPNGFYSFVNALEVPFFDPPRVHSQIRPGTHRLADGSPWDNSTNADSDGDGWPDDYTPSASDSLSDQFFNYSEDRLITMQTEIGGVIPLNYEVKYSPSDTSFESSESIGQDLLVIDIDSEIKHLDQNQAEITFGLEVSGIPEINLSSLAGDFSDDIQELIFEAIRDKLDEVSETLTGDLSGTLRPILQELIQPHVENAVSTLQSHVDNMPDIQSVYEIEVDLRTVVDQMLTDIDLENAFDATGADDMLTEIITVIDEVIAILEDISDAAQVSIDDLDTLAEDMVELALDILDMVTEVDIYEVLDNIEEVQQQIAEPLDEIIDVLNEVKGYLEDPLSLSSTYFGDLPTLRTSIDTSVADYLLEMSVDQVNTLDAEEITNLILDGIFNSDMFQDFNSFISGLLIPVKEMLYEQANALLDKLNDMVDEFLEEALDFTEGAESAFKNLSKFKGAEMEGYAVISGDVLEKLHIDASLELAIPDDMTFSGYLDINRYEVESSGKSCFDNFDSGAVLDIQIGAEDISLNWGTSDLSATIEFALMLYDGKPVNVGGSIITEGNIDFEAVTFGDLGFGIAIGEIENYIWAMGSGSFNDYTVDGGIFLGTCCTMEPLEIIDPQVASLLTIDEMSGVFAKVGASIPIYNYGCTLRVAAEAEIGAWYFAEGPTYGGKLVAGAYGEGLCIVAVKGEITLIGGKEGSAYYFYGEAWVAGGTGFCEPEDWDTLSDALNDKWCLACGASLSLTYKQEEWDVDYDAKCNE